MASALLVTVVKFGFLILLWLFVIYAVRTVRADLWGSKPLRPVGAGPSARPKTPKPATSARPGRRSAARRLVVTEGALAGTTISLGDTPVTLGRADDSTLVLTDDYASTRHARLVPSEDGWQLEDLGSTNGTYLGAVKVSRPVQVPLGQPIRIGKTVLELRR